MNPQLQKLKDALALINGSISRDEFMDAFQTVLSIVTKLEGKNSEAVTNLKETFADAASSIKSDASTTLEEVRAAADAQLQQLQKLVVDSLASIKPPKDGEPGKTPTVDELLNLIEPLIPPPQKGDKGDKGADATPLDTKVIDALWAKIDDLEKRLANVKPNAGVFIGPSRGVFLHTDGTKRGLQNTLNLIAGTNMSISYNRAFGRNDITLNATGGSGSLSVLTVTGTIDDTNTSFTTTSAPTLVIVNGAAYRDGHGCSISGTSITLDNPLGTGGDIYCLG